MKTRFSKDMFELPILLDIGDPLRAIPSVDETISTILGATTMEGYASEDPKWVEDWSLLNAATTLPVRYHLGGSYILITPENNYWFEIELRFDLGGKMWKYKFGSQRRPNMPWLKRKFSHIFEQAGLEWPAWRWG